MSAEGVPTPFKGKIEVRRRLSSTSEDHTLELCDPDALLRPLDLFKDFVRFKEGTEATAEQIKCFIELLDKNNHS